MSDSENIYQLWKQRAEIDYIPPFMALWLAFNARMRKIFPNRTDRYSLEELKQNDSVLLDRFAELIGSQSIDGTLFRGYLGELHQTLVKAQISYDRRSQIISFDCCMIEWSNGQPTFASIVAEKVDGPFEIGQSEINLGDDLWIASTPEQLFAVYIEIVYQIRCALFHGDFAPTTENREVIRHLYLTLSMIMENI